MRGFKLISFNVRSVQSKVRRTAVYDFLSSLNVDLIALQECCLNDEYDCEKAKQEWHSGVSVWSGEADCKNSGVGFLFCNNEFELISSFEIEPGRAILVKVKYQNVLLRFLNIYAPVDKEKRCDLFNKVCLFLPGIEPLIFLPGIEPLIFCGDFNCILESKDRKGIAGLDVSSDILKNLILAFTRP